jgi:Mrp family chromosome partitioning ATPase
MSYIKTKDEIIIPFGKGYAEEMAQKYNIPLLAKLPLIPCLHDQKNAYTLPELQINLPD